ncbi:MAG: hypothetical protein ACYSSI_03760 [Planctomycetota bacterium]|jgi:hypothetical protein
MSEADNNKQKQKIKTSKWAKASFCYAVFGWLIPIGVLTVVEILNIAPDNEGFNSFLIIPIASIGLMTFALVTGLVGIVEIVRGEGTVKGLGRIVVSLLAAFLFLLMLFLPYLGHRG